MDFFRVQMIKTYSEVMQALNDNTGATRLATVSAKIMLTPYQCAIKYSKQYSIIVHVTVSINYFKIIFQLGCENYTIEPIKINNIDPIEPGI